MAVSTRYYSSITLNQEQEICELYQQNVSLGKLIKLYHSSINTIKKILQKHDIPLRSKQEAYKIVGAKQELKFSFSEEQQIIEFYKTHSINETANNFGFKNIAVVKKVLAKHNIPERTKKETADLRVLRTQQTDLVKYGTISHIGAKNVRDKAKQTNLIRYGVENGGASKEAQEKIYKTKKKNHTFNTSKPEEIFYKKLSEKYGAQDVLRQYKDQRYPFMCDFYIKSKDLFIELNLHWTHGGHRFDKNSSKDLQKLNLWQEKAKTSNFYKSAIYVWTERDLYKLEIAKKANLNYKVIYSLKNYDL